MPKFANSAHFARSCKTGDFWKMQVTGSPEHRAIHEEMRVGVSPALVVGEIA